jgi:hypothetical protein|tara:strand:+ start:3089 stop:3757 length:669 start_codon:yes stop_codon:yes gene_type:complete
MKYRYEIKIPIPESKSEVIDYYLLQLKKLRIHNNDREINNIYFDTLNYDSAKDNLDGISFRTKYRIRWYKENEKFSNCNIELKIKNGRLNKKLVFPTKIKYTNITNINFFDIIKDDLINKRIHDKNLLVQKFFPILQNQYQRNYFIYDNEIRLTYDRSVKYKNLKTQSIYNWNIDTFNVLEIKFDESKLSKARELISKLYFVPKRHSKYLRGLSLCKMAIYI